MFIISFTNGAGRDKVKRYLKPDRIGWTPDRTDTARFINRDEAHSVKIRLGNAALRNISQIEEF